jgi:hypothetical protein
MIRVNKYEARTVEVFDNNSNSLGKLNDLELLDLCCQIAEEKQEGYYIKIGTVEYSINNDGRITNYEKVVTINGYTEFQLLDRLSKAQNK